MPNPPYGVTLNGFVRPTLNDIQINIVNPQLITTFGADIDLTASEPFGQISGNWSNSLDQVWQAAEDSYNSKYPDTAFGVSLDNVGALRGIPRLGALPSTLANVRLFGTPGTPIPSGTSQFSVLNSPTSLFAVNSAVTLVAGQSCVQLVTFSTVPAAGTWQLIGPAGDESTLLEFNADAAAVQLAVQALEFCSGCLVTGDYSIGFTITFVGPGTGGLMVQAEFGSLTEGLLDGGSSVVVITTAITTPGIDQGNVSLTAVADGPTVANAGTLTVIATPISGLSGVLNTQDAIVGRNVELDNPYRARMAEELQIAGASTLEAIRAKLLEVSGVTAVIIFENTSEVYDLAGRPPHSFECVVQGGSDADIAESIWLSKPVGIQTDGSSSYVITDSQGQNHTIYFSRPTVLTIYIIANLTVDLTYPSNGDTTVKDLLVTYGNSLGIGVSVIVSPKLIASIAGVQGIEDVVLLIGTAPAPTMSNNIAVASNQIAQFDTSRVTVNHL